MNLEGVQHTVHEYDQTNWLHEPGHDTTRHTLIHLLKTAGRLATTVEATDDGREDGPIDMRFVADLVIYAARFANNEDGSLDQAVTLRMQELRDRA